LSASSDGQTKVGYQLSITVGDLCMERRSYNTAAPYVNITVKLSGANSVYRRHGGACLSMPAQFSATHISRTKFITARLTSILEDAAVIGIDGGSNRSSLEAQHDWRPTFSHCRANVWNTLPVDVTSAPSLPSFKRRLKLNFLIGAIIRQCPIIIALWLCASLC